MNTTIGSPELSSAPSPLPANYGYHTRFSHSRDITMMASINGIERTPQEFKVILEAAGLKIKQIWSVRSQVSLIEAVLQDVQSEFVATENGHGEAQENGSGTVQNGI